MVGEGRSPPISGCGGQDNPESDSGLPFPRKKGGNKEVKSTLDYMGGPN